MAKTLIQDYKFKPGLGALENLYPNAYDLLSNNKEFIQKESAAWIALQVSQGATGFVGYTYNTEKCERDVGYNVDAWLKCLRYGGNKPLYDIVKYYWDGDTPQVDGDRQPEILTYSFINSLITSFILTNTAYGSINGSVTQTIDATKTSESTAITTMTTLITQTSSVIANGLSAFGTITDTGLGYIKFMGNHTLADILLVTNTTKNEIIYNFASQTTGGKALVKTDTFGYKDEDFAKYTQKTDQITTLEFNYSTSTHSATDELQVFIEKTENGNSQVITRPFDFGTDAIERLRVAQPLSMLDADFEYGLQPTKWAAIATLRGYPSVYELAGTDTPVQSVTTDASAGSSGIGASLITVTTTAAHGFEVGQAITIKALENSVAGAARAEGSFIITTVPSTITFQFYAKSKVGSSNGEVLSTTYTQLREANFYTGATISSDPTFTVASNGYSGTIFPELDNPTGSTLITFDGFSPAIGAPLIGTGLVTGTQVTNITDISNGGGRYMTVSVVGDYSTGDNVITLEDATGVVDNLGLDRGDGTATFIQSVDFGATDTITLTSSVQGNIIGNKTTYTSVSGDNVNSNGLFAEFDISRSNEVYTVDAVSRGGENYNEGDRLRISGSQLGGTTPANDLILVVTETFSDGGVLTVDVEGTAYDGEGTFNALQPIVNGGTGFGCSFDIAYTNNAYAVTLDLPGSGYTLNDRLLVNGPILGGDTTNNLIITVTGVGASGEITTITSAGTAPDGSASYNNPAQTYSGSGVDATFNISRTGTTYTATILTAGTAYVSTETIVIDGALLDGVSSTNDCTITIDNVGGAGEITLISVSGTAVNTGSNPDITPSNLVGNGGTFNITSSGGTYNVTIDNGGVDYGPSQTFTILGNLLSGETPTHDATITINTADASGTITGVNISGTANGDTASYTSVTTEIQQPAGTNALFNVLRDTEDSSAFYNTTIASGGADYAIGNTIKIEGDSLGGVAPLNDLTLQVTGVDESGAITSVQDSFVEAYAGDVVELYCSLGLSEPTNDISPRNTSVTYSALATIRVAFPAAHGLVPGDTFIVATESDDGSNNHGLADGSFFATNIPEINQLEFQARAAGAIDTSATPILGVVYPRPDSFFIHRPFDGGVQLGTGGPQHGAQAIRQSKKYIRYQSGKGIMYTTGALFAPSYDLRSVEAEDTPIGSLITIITDDNDHGCQVGGVIRLLGIEIAGFNSGPETAVPPRFDYEVVQVVDERTLKVRAQRILGDTSATLGFNAQMSVVEWHGATVRSGIFDDQNGIFWEYDGTQLSVVQRTSTKQITGTVDIAVDTNNITGANTKFTDQLKAGDRVVIKGMTHVVTHVQSDTACTVAPDWRGVIDCSASKMMLISDKKVEQKDFNMDRMDGTGPSGYNFDYAKMQMIGIQFSWYGAGFIDYMVRGADGNFIFAHRMRNSNINTEAFMRSGNLPVRYEVANEGPPGKLAEAMTDVQTSLVLRDSSFFPNAGTVYIDNEIIEFTANDQSTNTLSGLTRGANFSNFQAGATRTYSAGAAAVHANKTGVVLISNTVTPLISHWGSAFITDGMFDEDRGYIFSYAETGIQVSTTRQTAFLIRLAPSVSNAIVGDLGERELLNRAQLLLQGLEITSEAGSDDKGIVVEGILNPQNYPVNPADIGWTGLAGVAQGGQPSFAQIASGGSVVWSTGEAATTSNINSIAQVSTQMDSGLYTSRRNNRLIYINGSDYRTTFGGVDLTPVLGKVITGANIGSNVTITGGYISNSGSYGYFRISSGPTSNINGNQSDYFTILFNEALVNRNFAYLDQGQFQASGAKVGTAVTTGGGSVTFPSQTYINDIELVTWAGNSFYQIDFNNSFTGTLALSSGVIQFEFVQPPYAQPGETIFAFIATPGERATTDFKELKELTNTPLGGRGTYPNGPDVLGINVYKVGGAAIEANIVLRWGEAQA